MIKNIVILRPKKSLNFSESINAGVKNSSNSKIFIANDDIIISKQTMERLIDNCDRDTVSGPESNCNIGWLTDRIYNAGEVKLIPGMTLDQVDKVIPEIYNIVPDTSETKELDWLAFFATMIDRQCFEDVGYLDENFVYDKEDLDWSVRAKAKGKKFKYCFGSYCFHFGGISRKKKHKELGLKHDLDQEHNEVYYKNKYQLNDKPIIGFYCHNAWEYWDESSLNSSIHDGKPKGIGGSETQIILLSREFSKLGYKVKIFNKCKENHFDSGGFDVEYISFQNFADYSKLVKYDYFVASRYLDCFDIPFNSGINYAMIHDVFLIMGDRDQKDVKLDKIDKYFCLSNRHKKFVSSHHGIPEDKILVTSNGLDFGRFGNNDLERDPYKLIYSSSPDRGLELLLELFPRLDKKAHLHIYYGFENFKDKAYIDKMMDKINVINEKKQRIFYHGRVGQDELAKQFQSSAIWAYPTWFEETYCCLPGTKIDTHEGIVPIESVGEGTLVKTHKGRYREIEKTMVKQVSDHIKNIKIRYLKDNLKITKEHPLLVVKRNNKRFSLLKEGLGKTIIPEWLASEYLEEGDFILYPINQIKLDTSYLHSYSSSTLKNGKLTHPKTRANKISDFKLTEDFLEFCGWYVSEGCFDNKSVIKFSLNINEKKEANFIKSQIGKLGLSFWEETREKDSSRIVSTSSVILGNFLEDNFGKLAKNKKIPKWTKNLDLNYLSRFLKGVFKGDGCVDRNNLVYECASSVLVQDLFESLLKFAVVSSTSKIQKPKIYKIDSKIVRSKTEKLDVWRLYCSMNQNYSLFKSFDFEFNFVETSNCLYLIDSFYVYLPVKSIEEEEYIGKVYNFEVKEDNSYLANNVIVHNCITALEAMAGGSVVLSSEYWGLIDTVKDGGILWPLNDDRNMVFDPTYQKLWVNECNKLLSDLDYQEEWRQKGYERVKRFTWENVAKQWHDFWVTGEFKEIQ